jgi:iron(III) transport system permease protein
MSKFLFLSGMTTTSAVVFLNMPQMVPASVAIINMDETGLLANTAAMGVLIFLASGAFLLRHRQITFGLLRHTQIWRSTAT